MAYDEDAVQDLLEKQRKKLEERHREELKKAEAELQAARAESRQHLAIMAALRAKLGQATPGARATDARSGSAPAEKTGGTARKAEAEAIVLVPDSPEVDVVEEVLADLAMLRTQAEGKTSAEGVGQTAVVLKRRKVQAIASEQLGEALGEVVIRPSPRKERHADLHAILLDVCSPEEAEGGSGSETEARSDLDDECVPHTIQPMSVRLIEANLLQIRPLVVPKLRHRPGHDMTRALGGILISGDRSLTERHRAALQSEGVTHIVSCCPVAPATVEFRHLQIEFDDSAFVPILRLLKTVEDFLKSKAQGKQALIHCREGVNRCATIAVALRMQAIVRCAEQRSCGMPRSPGELLRDAWAKVAEYRGSPIITNMGFQRQLLLFANLLLLTDSQARWPEDWGPEVWLRPSSTMGLSRSQALKARTLREKVELACQDAGMCRGDAICAAARIVDLFLKRRGIVG